ncbi:alpha/beta hydrolase [Marinicella litoralis]|uniref:Esterase n=1 Tax=Marinicella litoralis TaxID=644220 RepID=A0A4R6XYW5_9GAMM|nr:alpha/beta hydrolase-fold protein [Marinicella litoralis]TDR23730.1 hypothetical protein C8D91_0595 [Marinicella litoralis]
MKLIVMVLLLLCGASQAAGLQHLTGLQGSEYHKIHSKTVDHDYHIYVHVPQQVTPDKKWPVVYLLDGGNTFPMFVPYAKYMTFLNEIPPVILVGISYGSSDWQQGNRRSTDFTLPAADREHYGGAEQFHRFLSAELMPLIEQKYPVDPKQSMLFGHSLGGQFALYTTQFQPQTFSAVIASNPAIHRNLDLFLAQGLPSKHQPKLFIMQADNDDVRFQKPRKKWLDYWQQKPHHWQLKVMTAAGHNHMSSITAAFRQGMVWLLAETKQPKQ